jgi:hypothetical protein
VKLADGRVLSRLTCSGYARIGARSEQITVMLEPESDEILIGVALLRALGLALLITRDQVLLLDQESIDEMYPVSSGYVRSPGSEPSYQPWSAS